MASQSAADLVRNLHFEPIDKKTHTLVIMIPRLQIHLIFILIAYMISAASLCVQNNT